MTTSISNLYSPQFPSFQLPSLGKVLDLTSKVTKLALTHFNAGCACILFGQGGLELYAASVQTPNSKALYSKTFLQTHAGLVIGSGVCSSLDALQTYEVINLGTMLTAIQKLGGVLFLFANFVALEENINIFEKLRHESSKEPEQQKIINLQRLSAIWGILSNLGYITATSLTLFGASTTMALILGVVSACCGGIKILCDFLPYLN